MEEDNRENGYVTDDQRGLCDDDACMEGGAQCGSPCLYQGHLRLLLL